MIIIQLSAQSGCDDELLTFSFYFFGPLKIPRKTQKKSFRPNKKNFFLHFLLLVLILVERERGREEVEDLLFYKQNESKWKQQQCKQNINFLTCCMCVRELSNEFSGKCQSSQSDFT